MRLTIKIITHHLFITRLCLMGCMMVLSILSIKAQVKMNSVVNINIYPDSILNDVSAKPLGINLDYLMDDDNYLKPKIRLANALKAMGVKYLRYPGGNKSDMNFFSKAPYNKSEPTLARTGVDAVAGRNRALNSDATGYKNDVLDFDEFMSLCNEVGAEPIIVVAADEYLVDYPKGSTWSSKETLLKNAVEWVKYANVKKKYNIKYWMIGNESWGPENKNSTADIYAQDVIDFSKAMKAIDPSIFIIPNGNSDEWWKTVLSKTAGHIDAICISNYPINNLPNGFLSYRDVELDLMHPVRTAINAITKYTSGTDSGKLKLIVAEYGPFDWGNKKWPFVNTMSYNLANFELTGQQLNEPKIAFSCFWNTRWIENDSVKYSVFDALDKNGNFNANGLGLSIWGNHLGNSMVKSTSTTHLRSFASYTADKKKLWIYLINKSDQKIKVVPTIGGYKPKTVKHVWELTSTDPEDTNPVFAEIPNKDFSTLYKVKPTSIKIIELIID